MNHSKTPWKTFAIGSEGYLIEEVNSKVSPRRIGLISYREWDELKANAEFIVKACNSHDELVEALEMARAFIFASLNWENGKPEDSETLKLIDKALQQAKGDGV